MSSRISSLSLCVIILTSCASSNSDPYPTYDPFAPVGATNPVAPIQDGVVAQPTTTPRGPTPTIAPLSVLIPTRGPGIGVTTPTPDNPHPLPPPREFIDQYFVEAGDTLGIIAQRYGIGLEALMDANGLNESSILSVGMVVNIPPVITDTNPGSSFKIVPDSELVYGPASAAFDVGEYLNGRNGYLSNYVQEVNGEFLDSTEIINRIAQNYSVHPRLLIALIEYRSGWLTNPVPANVDYPLGYINDFYAGLYRQLAWTADTLNRGYYLWRVNGLSTLPLNDGTYIPMDPTINAGTAGLQYFFSQYNERAIWDLDVSSRGFFQTYNLLFGYPFDFEIVSLQPSSLNQPLMRLPFEDGVTWSFTGGPHGGWDSGSAWAALDFAPPGEGAGCVQSNAWVVAAADGYIVRAKDGAVVQDLDNDGYEQTGWTILYMHVESRDRVKAGMYVFAGERIGHPSCEGGISNATHLHLARRYNGEWIPADGNLPFILDGWVSSGDGILYNGYLTKDTTILQAEEGVFEGVNQVVR